MLWTSARPVDLAAHRWPNRHGCLAFGYSLPLPGAVLSADLHARIWQQFADILSADWAARVAWGLADRHPEPFGRLQGLFTQQDPTCPAAVEQGLFLGPFNWLIAELACVEFCCRELGCRRNPELYEALESLVRWGSLTFTFGRLCIICERPTELTQERVLFSDAYCVPLGG